MSHRTIVKLPDEVYDHLLMRKTNHEGNLGDQLVKAAISFYQIGMKPSKKKASS